MNALNLKSLHRDAPGPCSKVTGHCGIFSNFKENTATPVGHQTDHQLEAAESEAAVFHSSE